MLEFATPIANYCNSFSLSAFGAAHAKQAEQHSCTAIALWMPGTKALQ